MNWDVHVWRTRDGNWRARINGTWRSNEYPHLLGLVTAVGFKILTDVGG